MTDQPANPVGDTEDGEPTGDAVVELRGLTLPVHAGFAGRVGRRIERRSLGNEFLEFAWAVPVAVVLELLCIPGQMLRSGKRPTTDSGS